MAEKQKLPPPPTENGENKTNNLLPPPPQEEPVKKKEPIVSGDGESLSKEPEFTVTPTGVFPIEKEKINISELAKKGTKEAFATGAEYAKNQLEAENIVNDAGIELPVVPDISFTGQQVLTPEQLSGAPLRLTGKEEQAIKQKEQQVKELNRSVIDTNRESIKNKIAPEYEFKFNYVNEVLKNNADLNFVQRILYPEKSVQLPDGNTATHLMAYSTLDKGDAIVYPTIVERNGKMIKLPLDEAAEYAVKTGEYIWFKNDKDAAKFSEGDYKITWDNKDNPYIGKIPEKVTPDMDKVRLPTEEQWKEEMSEPEKQAALAKIGLKEKQELGVTLIAGTEELPIYKDQIHIGQQPHKTNVIDYTLDNAVNSSLLFTSLTLLYSTGKAISKGEAIGETIAEDFASRQQEIQEFEKGSPKMTSWIASTGGGTIGLLADFWAFNAAAKVGSTAMDYALNQAVKSYTKSLLAKGISEAETKLLVAKGLKDYSKLISLASSTASTQSSLGIYNGVKNVVDQFAEKGNMADIDYGQTLKEIGSGVVMGTAIGGLGYGSSMAKSYLSKRFAANPTIKIPASVLTGAAEFGATNAVFVYGDALLRGENPKDVSMSDLFKSMATLGAMKIAHVPGMIKGENFSTETINKGEYNVEFTPDEISKLDNGKTSEEIIKNLKDKPDDLDNILKDESVPILTKQKLAWSMAGMRPENLPIANVAEVKDNKVVIKNSAGEVIEERSFDNKLQAEGEAVKANRYIVDQRARFKASQLNVDEKTEVLNNLAEKDIKPEDVNNAQETDPNERTGEQVKVLRSFNEMVNEQLLNRPIPKEAVDVVAEGKEVTILDKDDKVIERRTFESEEAAGKEADKIFEQIKSKEEPSYAKGTGKEAEAGGQKEGAVEGENGGLRLRDAEKDRVEAEAGKEVGKVVEPEVKKEPPVVEAKERPIEGEVTEPIEPAERLSGIKKALVPEAKVEEFEAEKRTTQQMLDIGKEKVDSGEIKPRVIVEEINKKPRALQPEEVSALVYYKMQLDSKFDSLFDKIEKTKEEGGDTTALDAEMNALNKEINDYHEMSLNTAYEQSLAFRLRQALVDSEYNLATQIRKYKQANNGVIPADIEAKFKEYDSKLKEIEKKLRDYESKKETAQAERDIAAIEKKIKKEAKTKGKDLIVEGFDELAQALGITQKAYGEKRPDILKALTKIGKGLIQEGSATIDTVIERLKKVIDEKYKGKINIDEYSNDIITSLRQDIGKPEIKNGKLKILHDLIRDYVSRGVIDINELTKKIHEQVVKDLPDVTERQVRDAITEYGKTANLSKEEIEVKIREMKRIGRLISGLEDVQKENKRPLRSGLQRDKPTDKERRLQKELKEAMKDLPQTEEESNKAWKSALDAIKTRLNNQIRDLEAQISTGQKTPKKKGVEYDAEASALAERRDQLKKIIEDIEGKPKMSDEQKVKIAIGAAKRSAAEYERRIKEKDFAQKQKQPLKETPELKAARDRFKEAKELYKQLQEESGAAEKNRLDIYKKNLNKSIAEYERRIREKDFEPKKPKEKPQDEEAIQLEMEKIKIKNKFDIEQEKVRLKNRPLSQKLFDYVVDILNFPRTLLASTDLSAPLRQGVILSLAHPTKAAKAFPEMFRQAFSAKKAEDWVNRVKASPEYPTILKSKLYISEDTTKLSAKEEQFMSNLAHKIPLWGKVIKGSERAYVAYLNKIRVDTFTQGADYLTKKGYSPNKNPEVYKALADFINYSTGRGDLGIFQKAAPILNATFFSPRLIASRVNLLNPYTYIKMPAPVRKMALRDMMIFIGVNSMIIGLAAAAGADVETDPRSSDFGKIRMGDIRFDTWAGFQQWVRLIAQLVSGQTKSTTTGEVRDLSGTEYPYTSRLGQTLRFFRGKLSPTMSLAVDLLEGQSITGEEKTVSKEIAEKTVPLYMQDMYEIFKEEGAMAGTVSSIPALFGVGVQYYGKDKKEDITKELRDAIDSGDKEKEEELTNKLIKIKNREKKSKPKTEEEKQKELDEKTTQEKNKRLKLIEEKYTVFEENGKLPEKYAKKKEEEIRKVKDEYKKAPTEPVYPGRFSE